MHFAPFLFSFIVFLYRASMLLPAAVYEHYTVIRTLVQYCGLAELSAMLPLLRLVSFFFQ